MQTATENEKCLLKLRLSVARLNSFLDFGREKTEHENAPNIPMMAFKKIPNNVFLSSKPFHS